MIHISADIISQMISHAAVLKLTLAKQFSLTLSQLLALLLVGSNKTLSIKELRGQLSLPGSSVTFATDSLEKKGLIKRHRSKKDKRQWFLSLTPGGEELYKQVVKVEGEVVLPALDKLSESEKDTFLKLTQEIMQSNGNTPQR